MPFQILIMPSGSISLAGAVAKLQATAYGY